MLSEGGRESHSAVLRVRYGPENAICKNASVRGLQQVEPSAIVGLTAGPCARVSICGRVYSPRAIPTGGRRIRDGFSLPVGVASEM